MTYFNNHSLPVDLIRSRLDNGHRRRMWTYFRISWSVKMILETSKFLLIPISKRLPKAITLLHVGGSSFFSLQLDW